MNVHSHTYSVHNLQIISYEYSKIIHFVLNHITLDPYQANKHLAAGKIFSRP